MPEVTVTTREVRNVPPPEKISARQAGTGRRADSSPVQRWEGTGRGSAHRAWRESCRRRAQNDSTAYHEAGNALCRAIKESSVWPWALDKKLVIRRIRRLYAHMASLREAEAKTLVQLGIEYNAAFTKGTQKLDAFDPTA